MSTADDLGCCLRYITHHIQQGPEVIVVRVRLPDGSSHTRRWLAETGLDVVHDWVQSLEAMPL
jgi:hypothetical protein